jgi:PAS domain S-box-containing protein
MVPTTPPTSDEITSFLGNLRQQRERLLALAGSGSTSTDNLAQTIDEIGEDLLVADEELRVQNEHLTQSTQRLDLVVAAHEELFANAPVAYVQTDSDGLIIRYNRAARRLLGLPTTSARSRPLANLMHPDDRAALRGLTTRLRAATSDASFVPDEPMELTVVLPDGAATPVVVTGRLSSDGDTGRPVLHWELQEHSVPSDGPVRVPAVLRRSSTRTPEQVQAIAEAALDIAEQQTPEMTVEHVARQARSAVPSCDEVGVTIVSRGRVETPASTGQLAAECDQIQHELGEGPCLAVIEDGKPVRVSDVAHDTRWPQFGPRAARLGAASMLVLPLATSGGTVGALSLYATTADAFDDDDELLGAAFAKHAGIALSHSEVETNLRTALQTREEIGRAVGILMERHRITATAAFDMLVLASQHSHRKLRDVAAWMNETGEDPAALVRAARDSIKR